MKTFFFLLWVVVAGQFPSAPRATEEKKATIEGVVRSETGDPLPRAELALTKVVPPPDLKPGESFEYLPPEASNVTTDSEGRFVFKEVVPGEYRLRAKRNGFVAQWHGQRHATDQGKTITVIAGQELKDVAFRLLPSSTVTGRVRDPFGDPAVGTRIMLFKRTYDNLGTRTFATVGSATTDDRGEYRIFGITPGRYFLSASTNSGPMYDFYDPEMMRQSGRENVVGLSGQPATFYPGTPEFSQALPLDIVAGSDLSGIDIGFQNVKLYRVRGSVVDDSGKPPRNLEVVLHLRGMNRWGTEARAVNARYVQGQFEFKNVLPGSYWLSVSQQRDAREPLPEGLLANVRTTSELYEVTFGGVKGSARIPVDVSASDIDSLVVKLSPGFTVPLQVILEGGELSSAEALSNIRIGLWPRERDGAEISQFGSLDPKGFGKFVGVPAGEYRAWIYGELGGTNYYLKEARLGSIDALDGFLRIEESSTTPLRVVLSSRTGTIEGTLTDNSGKPLSSSPVYLIPNRSRYRDELNMSTGTDPSGHFKLKGVPPGDYKIFAWESIEPFSWYDPDILAKYEMKGTPAHIEENSNLNVTIKQIPPIE